jgi:hypothetical protein
MRAIALILTELITLARSQRVGFGGAVLLPPTEQQVQLFTTIEIVGLALVSLIGIIVLVRVWSYGRRPAAEDAYVAVGREHIHETGAGRAGYS